MDRFPSFASVLIVAALFALSAANAHAQELYKWSDASGNVHYGDRAAAPENGVPISVPVAPGRQPFPSARPAPGNQVSAASRSQSDAQIKPSPTDRVSMSVECTSLIAKIENTQDGANWKQLSRQFNETCPGIAYECQADRATAQNHRCGWIDKSAGTVPDKTASARNRKMTSM